MGIDLLRSCYSTKMAIHADAPTVIDVDWFFCEDDAQVFPGYTIFGSGNWASSRYDWPGLGEVEGAPRLWRNGSIPDGSTGQKYCGTLAMFLGEGSVDDKPLCIDAQGICSCCSNTLQCCDLQFMPAKIALRLIQIQHLDGEHIGQLNFDYVLTKQFDPILKWYFTGAFSVPAGGLGGVYFIRMDIRCESGKLIWFAVGHSPLGTGPILSGTLNPLTMLGATVPVFFQGVPFGQTAHEIWTMAIGNPPFPSNPGGPFLRFFPPQTFPPGTFPT